MFETLYKDPATIERYRLAPLLEERERYVCAVLASGVVGDVARRVARTQLALMDLLSLPDADIPIGFATVEAAVREWCRNVPAVSGADFRRHAFRWLRFLGWLEEPVRDAHPHARQVEAFAAWMRDDRGLSEATVGNCCYQSDRLFVWAAGRNLMLAGFDLDASHLAPEVIDYGDPAVTARDVVDRETLKAFVTQAGNYFLEIIGTGDAAAALDGFQDGEGRSTYSAANFVSVGPEAGRGMGLPPPFSWARKASAAAERGRVI